MNAKSSTELPVEVDKLSSQNLNSIGKNFRLQYRSCNHYANE